MAIFTDTFTDTNGTQLQSHTPDVGSSWTRLWGTVSTLDLEISSNACRPESDNDDGVIYTADATYPSADYYIEVTFNAFAGGFTRYVYLLLRIQDSDNLYAFGTTGDYSYIFSKVSGSWNDLTAELGSIAAGSVVKFEVVGDTLTVYDDGVIHGQVTDSDISSAGKAGLAAGALRYASWDANNANTWDNLTIDVAGAGDSIPYLANKQYLQQHYLVR